MNSGCTNSGKASVFDVLSSVQKECLDTEPYLEDTSLEKESLKIQNLVDIYGKVKEMNLILKVEMASLVQEIKRNPDPQDKKKKKKMAEIVRMIQLPENDFKRFSQH